MRKTILAGLLAAATFLQMRTGRQNSRHGRPAGDRHNGAAP